jgi:iron complex outermembrane receptor protein
MSLEELLEINVTTGTKTERALSEVPVMMEVVTAKEIRERGYRSLGDVMQDLVDNHEDGVNWGIGEPVQQNVGFGFRFDTSQNILLLFNGQRLNAFLPGNRFGGEEYLLDNVERIEIIRGPGSALYGANAFTAVVNIISKTSFELDEKPHLRAALGGSARSPGGGFESSWKARVGKGGFLSGAIRFGGEEGQQRTVRNDLFGDTSITDGLRHALDGDLFFSYKRLRMYAKFDQQVRQPFTGLNSVTPGTDDRMRLAFSAYAMGADYTQPITETVKVKTAVGWHLDNFTEVALVPIFQLNATGDGLARDANGNPILDTVSIPRDGRTVMTSFPMDGLGVDTMTLDGEAQLTWNYRDRDSIIIGVNGIYDKVLNPYRESEIQLMPYEYVSFRRFTDDANNWMLDNSASRRTVGLYGQIEYNVAERLFVNAGARVDFYGGAGSLDQNYTEFNPRGGFVYKGGFLGNFKGLVGTATRIPNGFETLMKVIVQGNPDNRPERLMTVQGNWEKRWATFLSTEVGGFYSVLSNHLVTDANISDQQAAQGYVGRYVNVTNADLQNQGIDGKVQVKFWRATLNANVTRYLSSDDGTGHDLAYIPLTMANANVGVPVWWFHYNLGANFRGDFTKAPTDPRPTVNDYLLLSSVVLFNPPASPFAARLGVRNMLNAQIQYPASSFDYTTHFPGRGAELWGDVSYTLAF